MPAAKVTSRLRVTSCQLAELKVGDWFLVENQEVDEVDNLRMLIDWPSPGDRGERVCVDPTGSYFTMSQVEGVTPVEVEITYKRT